MAIIKATLAKEDDDGNVVYIYPKTTADMVEYDEETDIKTKIDNISDEMNAAKISYDEESSIKDKIDYILEEMDTMTYEKIAISNFAVSSIYVEYGNILTTLNFSWQLNRIASTLKLTGGSSDSAINANISGDATNYNATNLKIKDSVEYTLTATDKKQNSTTAKISIGQRRKYFYGVGNRFNSLTNLLSELRSSRTMSFTVNATSGNYIYFACPIDDLSSLPSFNVGGFDGGFTLLGLTQYTTTYSNNTFSGANNGNIVTAAQSNITNTSSDNGNSYTTTQTYAVYISDNASLGTTTVNVK